MPFRRNRTQFHHERKMNCDKVTCFSVMLHLAVLCICLCQASVRADNMRIFHNHFAVHIENASSETVEGIAAKHGFRNLGQIGDLEGYYLFEHNRIRKRSTERSDFHHEKLVNEPGVLWVEQQFEKKRVKRDFASLNPQLRSFGPSNFALGKGSEFPDPSYAEQWYLHGGGLDGFDMNVIPAWRKGYSGKGVVVSILDDGIQTNHPDLAQNYDPLASTDINDNDDDPMPRDNGDNKHGTRCAGEVAAVAFNSYCGVGIAFNASIGGVRMLDGTVNDAVEARALSLNPDHIDIYSASWGPEDDGKTVDGPGPLAKRAFINGIMKGRKGKGSIFIWASGNGGRHEDSCNCDGYTNSIFTLSISSATQAGFKPWYLEECSSTLATTYSSGRPDVDRSIATVDMDGSMRREFLCTSDHTGTSASAPLAAGICALALEANPNLTWRDMQHLVVFTSRPDPLHDSGWVTNGIGKKVSHKFGYGLMDAAAMVATAEQWTNVPPQHVCQTPADTNERLILNGFGQKLEVLVDTDACAGTPHEIRYLEHVQCRISLRFAPRGNLRIRLTSPSGTPSVLLFERPRDVLDSSFEDWPFMTVHFWGERAAGRWKLEIINAGNKRVGKAGVLKKWQLVFYGTDTNPVRLSAPRFANGASRAPNFGTVATTGRDVHNRPSQPPPPPPTRFNSRFPTSQVFFPDSGSSFRPSLINPNTGAPDFLSFSGSEPVTYRVPFNSSTTSAPKLDRLTCPKYIMNSSCVDVCPATGFYVTNDQRCEICHDACSSCAGPGPDRCIQCSTGYNSMIDKSLCVKECPEFYRLNEAKKTCIPCPPQCQECTSSLSCTVCAFRFVLHEGRCLASCLPGFYETDDYGCAACDSACATCRGPGADHCVTCANGSVEHSGKCIDDCPLHYWRQISGQQCLPCPPGCETCHLQETGLLHGLICTSCAPTWVLDPTTHQCLDPSINVCSEGEYIVNGKCYPCHGTCGQCSGPSSRNCTQCPNNTSMHEGSCVEECPQGFYSDIGSQGSKAVSYCLPCPLSCARCDGSDRCTECVTGLHLQDGQCFTACHDGYYSDRGVCVRCHGSCSQCSGPLATDCLRCSSGFSWMQQRCLSSCPIGYYSTKTESLTEQTEAVSDSQLVCVKCDINCRTCEGNSSNCLSCSDGFAFNKKKCESVYSLVEIPLVEFVKEAEGRGTRAGKDVSQISNTNTAYYWIVGICASLIIAMFVVFIASQRSTSAQRYQPVPLERGNETGVEKFLLSPADLEDEEAEMTIYKV